MRGPWMVLLWVGVVVYLSLFPFQFREPSSWAVTWSAPQTRKDWVDVAVNILFYMPLGGAVASFWRVPAGGLTAAISTSLVLSYAIETIQLAVPGRTGNLRDTLWNSVGALCGAGLTLWLRRWTGAWSWGKRIEPVAGLWAACWLFWQAFPFMPALRMWKLEQIMAIPGVWPSWLTLGDLFFGGATLALAVGRRQWWLPAGLLAIVGYGGLLAGRVFSWMEIGVAGLGLGWGLLQERATARWAALLTVWLIFRELSPFRWSWEAQPFQWVPFAVSFELPVTRALPVLAGKLMTYSMAFWIWRVGAGWRPGPASAVVLGSLAVGEYLQRYLPERHPDITDLLLGLSAVAVTWRLVERGRPA